MKNLLLIKLARHLKIKKNLNQYMTNPKFSIITPSYNQGLFIRNTIESVMNQNYENFEHIVIDGGSTDNTIDILKEYPHLIWISEKDNGPAHAINKGYKLATGDITTWLNSDDFFADNIFNKIADIFLKNPDAKIICGMIKNINLKGEVIYIKNLDLPFSYNYLINISADIIKQPATFYTRDLYNEVNGLDESLKLVFDYELFIKMLKKSKPILVNEVFAYQRDYDTTLSRKFMRTQAVEIFRVSRKYNGRLLSRLNIVNIRKIFFPKGKSFLYKTLKIFDRYNKNKYV
jgi:glycosyltransferase involved in cell wall biosynthesis